MRILIAGALSLMLAACGSDDDGDTATETTNSAPVVDAGADQTVAPGDTVTLDATASDADGNSLTYAWVQDSGASVDLSDAAAEDPTFTAPNVSEDTDIAFTLSVSDGTETVTDVVTITVVAAEAIAKADYYSAANLTSDPEIVDCTLADGTETKCLQVTAASYYESDDDLGPFCPETLDDIGGIWPWDGENAGMYRLDREFWEMLHGLGYTFYDDDGNINIQIPTDIDNETGLAACLHMPLEPEIETTTLIPIYPKTDVSPTEVTTVSHLGLALDGTPVFGDAPSVLFTGNLPALDYCGGHVDPGSWYHHHLMATDVQRVLDLDGVDVTCPAPQSSSALFGFASDGFPMFGSQDADGTTPDDLDDCRGHTGPTELSDTDMYHYHSGTSFYNLPRCLVGVTPLDNFSTTASAGIGAEGTNPRPGQ